MNTTPVGMSTGDEPHFFSAARVLSFEPNALAFDLIYTPENTSFLKTLHERGLATVGGLPMLIGQALANWKIWTGENKNLESLRPELTRFLHGILRGRENEAPIFLTGFMGVGKTTVGKELAQLMGRTFVDTDQLVREETKTSIAEIFSKHGEGEFRNLEKKAVVRTTQLKNSVVALGGGALLSEENLNAVKGSGILIYLKADEKTLIERIALQGEVRPLLADLKTSERLEKIKTMLESRRPLYEKAKLTVVTDGASPTTVAHQILMQLGDLKR